MRKRSKYRPKPVHLNNLERVIEAVSPISTEHASYFTDLLIKNHAAMLALTRGAATRHDMDLLIAMANIMEAFRQMEICTPLANEIAAGRRALIDIAMRAVKVSRFVATGPEIQALNTLMELHDELMPHITGLQLDKAIDLAKKIIRRREATVLPTANTLMEAS